MHGPATHLGAVELEQGLSDVLESPHDTGKLVAIFVRPTANERQTRVVAELSLDGGIDGDRWVRDSFYRLEDGRSDPRCQLSLMNARILRQIAGQDDAMCLAGDNLIVDLDVSEENLPAGSQLVIGTEVVVELSDLKHTGCSKFAYRYGDDARAFVNTPRGKALHLRGRYARIIRGGSVSIGDTISKCGT